MKYIRTKDGIYETKDLIKCEDPRFPNGWFTKNGVPLVAIKEADTIKELCDVWVVWVKDEFQDPVPAPICKDAEKAYELARIDILLYMHDGTECWLKLGIWVEDGMRYVAKMNSKGDFVLL